jgi:hypothetical protein
MLAEVSWQPSWIDVVLTWVVGTIIVTTFVVTFALIIWMLVTLIREW